MWMIAAGVVFAAVVACAFLFIPGRALAATYTGEEIALVNQINEYRASLGLQRLMVSDLASDAARKHSSDMGTYGFFGHTTQVSAWFPVGADAHVRLAMCGYSFQVAWGENIAGGYSKGSGVFTAWKNSGDHNRIMTDPAYKVVGVGSVYVSGSPYGWYWTLDFGAYVDETAHWVGNDVPGTSSTTTSSTTTTTVPSTTSTTTTSSTTTTIGGPRFADVSSTHSFYEEIMSLACEGILSGCADGLFHPDNPVTRAQFAKIIILALGRHTAAMDNTSSPTFRDLPFAGSEYPFDYVEEAAVLGIIGGFPDGTFRPQSPVTRAQLALMLARAGGDRLAQPPTGYVCPFRDVPSYAKVAVTLAYYNSLVNGKTATTFDPYAQATRGQVAKMVYRLRLALGL
jgi:hypothetical protein